MELTRRTKMNEKNRATQQKKKFAAVVDLFTSNYDDVSDFYTWHSDDSS